MKSAKELGLSADARIAAFRKCGPKNPTYVCACCDSGLRLGAIELRSYTGGYTSVLVGRSCAVRLLKECK